jgi:hypothetical protein
VDRDYEGGRVTIVGNEYPHALPASPIDHVREGTIIVKLEGLNAVNFNGFIGADAFPRTGHSGESPMRSGPKGMRHDI